MAITYTPLKDEILSGGEVVSGLPTGSKEQEPLSSPIVFEQVKGENSLPSDISNYVVKRPEQISISPDLQSAGLRPNESISFPETFKVTLPLSEEKIKKGLKERIGSSIRWFSELLKRRMLLKTRTA